MAVRIRLQRHGRKKRPFYRLVAADARAQRDGRFLERLGHYNPLTDPAEVVIDEDRVLKWLKRGAQPSDTAKNLLSRAGIWERFTAERLGKPVPTREEEPPLTEEDAASPTDEETASADDS
ncbi:MAG: 30S ribosomal protein S16 [Candidatus Poribacteria bacterium]|nr:30S ribosomal protein S16 [Candidatus Poribacteria bacterium]MDE0504968.1 30S ribosomal protein S16 [Candidatus Poribacteria bacterium]